MARLKPCRSYKASSDRAVVTKPPPIVPLLQSFLRSCRCYKASSDRAGVTELPPIELLRNLLSRWVAGYPPSLLLLGRIHGFGEGGDDFHEVADDAVVCDFEDGGVRIFVDGDDAL